MADRSILDEAVAAFEQKLLGPPIVPRDYDLAAVVIRVAEKQLRAYGYYDAANAIVEGIDTDG